MFETFVLFEVHNVIYGMDIQNVVSIEKAKELSTIPKIPEYMVGIVNIRGQIIPVMDTSSLLCNHNIKINEHTRYILIETNETIIALMVEKMNEIIEIASDEVKPVKSLATGSNDFIKGVALQENRIITMLDIDILLSSLNDIDLIRENMLELNQQTEKIGEEI